MSRLNLIDMFKNESAETFNKCSKAYELGRADAERDFQKSDYWNDYLAKVIVDAKTYERKNVLDEIEKSIDSWWDEIRGDESNDDKNWYTSLKMLLEELQK